jgi:sporulation protein YlmC with PRC-barrel domain
MKSNRRKTALRQHRSLAKVYSSAVLLLGVWLLVAAVGASAADRKLYEHPYQSDPLIKASYLSGKQVTNRNGDIIGIVKDMLLNIKRNRIQYVVLSIGGILGMGDKLIAVPVGSLRILTKGDAVMLDADAKQIDQAPEIGDTNWPQQPDFSAFKR